MIELAVLLRCRPSDVYELDELELATLIDVIGENGRRRG